MPWRCTSTSSCEGRRPNRAQASISSKPLFIMVAESTEILRPMFQTGWAQASSGVTSASVSSGRSSSGPPEAVRMQRRTPRNEGNPLRLSGRHCSRALCSLSNGNKVAPLFAASSRSRGPSMTKGSLFATSTRLPARTAAKIGARPAAPTMPDTAMAQSVCNKSGRESGPSNTVRSGRAVRTSAAAAASLIATTFGPKARHCSIIRPAF